MDRGWSGGDPRVGEYEAMTKFSNRLQVLGLTACAGVLLVCSGCREDSVAKNAQDYPPVTMQSTYHGPDEETESVASEPAAPTQSRMVEVPNEEFAFMGQGQPQKSEPLPEVFMPPASVPHGAPASIKAEGPTPVPAAPTTNTPVDYAKAGGPRVYIMQKGDTLYGVAKKFGVSPKDLIAANNFTNPHVIPVGAKVVVPN